LEEYMSFQPYVVIPQFVVIQSKDDGTIKERGIQDGSAAGLNEAMAASPCWLPSIDDIFDALFTGGHTAMRDLTNAFWHWVYNSRFVLLLGGVSPSGLFFVFRNLLMGLTNSPAVQQRFATDIARICMSLAREHDLAVTSRAWIKPYIDDFTIHAEGSVSMCKSLCDKFDWVVKFLGVESSIKKATPPELKDVTSLGLNLSTEGMGRGTPGPSRLHKYIKSTTDISVALILACIRGGAAHLPAGAMAVLAGRLGFIRHVVRGGRFRMRALYSGSAEFAAARLRNVGDDGNWRETPPEGYTDDVMEAGRIARAMTVIAALEFDKDLRSLEHPLSQFWWQKQERGREDDEPTYDPRFPVTVTAELVETLEWWERHATERAGIPLNLNRPDGFKGRFRGGRDPLDHDYIDRHSRTHLGDDVITGDAATHGDLDPRARSAFWFRASERHVIVFPEGEEYEIMWLEGVAMVKGFEILGPLTTSDRVWLRNDNLPIVMCIEGGTCKNKAIQKLLELLGEWEWTYGKQVAACWLCTKCNWLADGISRGTIKPSSCDFMFDPDMFEALINDELKGARPDIDGFSNESGDNSLCARFCSLQRSFYKTNFAGCHVWINADFLKIQSALMHWVGQKRLHHVGTRATVIVPKYRRRRPWLSILEKHFTLLKTYKKGARLFLTIPAVTHATDKELNKLPARKRTSVGPTRWPVQIWHCR
jgi:hypothetical protein